jgi:CubicO group peptidase (beta-lactamase class C family)
MNVLPDSQNLANSHYFPARRISRRAFIEASLAGGAGILAAPMLEAVIAAQTPAGPATPVAGNGLDELFAAFDAFLGKRMDELKIPGLAAGVIVGDREHTAVFGVTNVDHPLPVDADTMFQIGSTTKTFTGTTIMRLVEQGKLDLEAPVRTYLPEFRVADPDVSAEVRLRHLVTHTAGWLDNGLDVETGDGDDALARYVEEMADLPQIAPPGEYFSYNNGAVSLAGRVIEAVTGQTYEAAVAELVLEPLGMERASFFAEQIITEKVAAGHGAPPDDPGGAPVVHTPWALPRVADPAGGLISTLNDELRYARFHLGDGTANGVQLLSAHRLKQMRTPQGPGGTVPQLVIENVGINWMLRTRGGETVISHAGGTYGQQSDLCLVPERGFAVTTLTNADAGAVLAIEATDWALDRFLGLPKPERSAISLLTSRPAEYTGEYVLPEEGAIFRVIEADGGLRIETLAPGQTEPTSSSPLTFIGDDLATVDYMGFPIFTDFVRNDADTVAWLRYFGRMIPRAS